MQAVPKILFVVNDPDHKSHLHNLVSEFSPALPFRFSESCEKAIEEVQTRWCDLMFVLVEGEMLTLPNNDQFVEDITTQHVGDVAALLEVAREQRTKLKTVLLSDSVSIFFPAPILRILGCHCVLSIRELPEPARFQELIYQIFNSIGPRYHIYGFPYLSPSQNQQAAKLFLSYAREDEAEVRNICKKLADLGLDPWMDQVELYGGQEWEFTVGRAIQDADFFIPFLSKNAVNNLGFFQREIEYALDIWNQRPSSDIYMIPVCLDSCEIPRSLNTFQYIKMDARGGLTKILQSILKGVERQLPKTFEDKVLVVDNNIDACRQLKDNIQEYGFEVVIAQNECQALKTFRNGTYRVVVLDLFIPYSDGMRILDKMLKQDPETKIIMLTGYADHPSSLIAWRRHAFDYISKYSKVWNDVALSVLRAFEVFRHE